MEDLRRDVEPRNTRNFEVLSEGYVDQIADLKAEIEGYAAKAKRQRRTRHDEAAKDGVSRSTLA